MTPAEHVRIVLREYRARGVPFDVAWTSALHSLPRAASDERAAWVDALQETRHVFELHFNGTAPADTSACFAVEVGEQLDLARLADVLDVQLAA